MTKIIMDGKELKELHIHLTGEDAEFVYFEGVTECGQKISTMYLKGTT